jgi:DNA-binding response OmpR family regulator
MTHVLIVEDAPDAAEFATAVMRSAGFDTSVAPTAAAAERLARAIRPDVILLDLGLPDRDGTDLCRSLREHSDAYIVMMTSRDDEIDKVLGLKLGADDYVTKPYSPREVLARVEALLRRPRAGVARAVDATRRLGDLVVHPEAHRVTVDGVEVQLTRIEFGILDALTEDPHRTVSRAVLCERVWGDDWLHDDHVVDVHIANLRKKIDRQGIRHIRTVRGVGYRMADPAEHPADPVEQPTGPAPLDVVAS